jgi:nucleotidyltransferase/DNA polymerase involved in DNA repair
MPSSTQRPSVAPTPPGHLHYHLLLRDARTWYQNRHASDQCAPLCQQLIQCPAHPERYAATSAAIMQALQDITPDIEVFSVDEAYLVPVDPELADAVHERWPRSMSGESAREIRTVTMLKRYARLPK